MGHWIKQRLALIILASIAVIVLSITVAIATIQAHSSLATQQAASTPAPTTTPAGHDSAYQASGTIESIAYDANSTQSGKLLFLANTSQQAVSVVFTSQTTIALMDASGASISAPLASGIPGNDHGHAPCRWVGHGHNDHGGRSQRESEWRNAANAITNAPSSTNPDAKTG